MEQKRASDTVYANYKMYAETLMSHTWNVRTSQSEHARCNTYVITRKQLNDKHGR